MTIQVAGCLTTPAVGSLGGVGWAKNQMVRSAPYRIREIFCVVEGPEGDWAVVDLATAIELGNGYRWSTR